MRHGSGLSAHLSNSDEQISAERLILDGVET